MDRVTIRDCKAAVVRLASALGVAVLGIDKDTREIAERLRVPVATFTKDDDGRTVSASDDCLVLDYGYGGAVVEMIHRGSTGRARPFGAARLHPAAFVRALGIACDALRFRERVEAVRI